MAAILKQYFGDELKKVSEFLIEGTHEQIQTEIHSLSANTLSFFDQAYIVVHEVLSTSSTTNSLSMRQVLRHAVGEILDRQKSRFGLNTNVFSNGFKKSDANIVNTFPNSLHNHFLSEPWIELHQVIGDDLFMQILIKSSIFIPFPGSKNFIQITGQPLSEKHFQSPSDKSVGAKPTIISRQQFMYGTPLCFNAAFVAGLSLKHFLNRNSNNSEILALQIFYGKTQLTKRQLKHWQYKHILSLAKELAYNHRKCHYTAIFQYFTSSFVAGPVSNHQVIGFCFSVLCKILPKAMLKNLIFRRHIKKKLITFITLPRFEKLSLTEILSGLSLKSCSKILDPKSSSHFSSQSDFEKQNRLLNHFLCFLFNDYLVDLVRSNFYVTESSQAKTKLFYFRHDVWRAISTPELELYQKAIFNASSTDEKAAGKCRLIPKPNGKFRPITSYRPSPSSEESNRLRASFDLLRHFFEVDKSVSVIGFSQLQDRLLKFKNASSGSGPFFIAKLDIAACFDSIPHGKLFKLLESIFPQDKLFAIKRVDQVQLDLIHLRPQKRINRVAFPLEQVKEFIPTQNNSSVIVDRVFSKLFESRDILETIKDHISKNLVQIEGKTFRQKLGIPQGSFLSTILCSLFYGDFDREIGLVNYRNASDFLILRYIDDFILISPDRSKVYETAKCLEKGWPKWGITINSSKTSFNFDIQTGEICQEYFNWCGLKLHSEDLAVKADYSNFESTNLGETLTRERVQLRGLALRRQMQYFLRPKLRKLFHQSNPIDVVVINIAESYGMVAMKTCAYLRGLSRNASVFIQPKWLQESIDSVVQYGCALIRVKEHPDIAKRIGYRAFYHMFGRKRSKYVKIGLWSWLKKRATIEFPVPVMYEVAIKCSLDAMVQKIKY